MGLLHTMNGDQERGQAACHEAIEIVTDLGTPDAVATAHGHLGEVFLWGDEPERAEAAFRTALETWRSIGNMGNVPYGLQMLGRAVGLQGKATEAIQIAEELQAIVAREDVASQAAWRETRALAAVALGDPRAAEALLNEAIELRLQTDEVGGQALTWLDLSGVRLALGDRPGAAHAASQALRIYEAKESPVGIRWATDRLEGARSGRATARQPPSSASGG